MKILPIIAILFFTLWGCQSQKTIDSTQIEDTEENRSLIQIANQYNQHINQKNVEKLFELASKEYYDNGGTATTEDDFGYGALKKRLQERFALISEINQKIKVTQIIKNDDRFFITYHYDGRFLINVKGKKRWHTKQDMNQLVLIKSKNGFKIIKGM